MLNEVHDNVVNACALVVCCVELEPRNQMYKRFRSAIAKVRYRKGPGWTGLDTNYNCQ